MNEIEVLEREFDSVPAPEEATVAAARAAIVREIAAAPERSRVRARRNWVRLAVVAGVAALLATVVTVAIPNRERLTGADIAAAAYRAVTPVDGRIWHRVMQTTRRPLDGTAPERAVWERWVATSPPYGLHDVSPGWGEAEMGPCGSIRYVARDNLLRVWHARLAPNDPRPYDVAINGAIDPARQFRSLFRSGRVRYRGETTFRGIEAYRLIVGGREVSITYLVRRDNFYPLRTVRRTQTYIETMTFTKFEYLPRNAHTSKSLHVGRHPGASLLQTGPRPHGPCAGFGSSLR